MNVSHVLSTKIRAWTELISLWIRFLSRRQNSFLLWVWVRMLWYFNYFIMQYFRVSIYKEKYNQINHSCVWLLFLNYTDVLFMSLFFILETPRKTLKPFLTCSSFLDISHIRYFLNNAICTAHTCLISCKKPYSDTNSYLSQHCLLIIHAAQPHQRSFHQSVSPW